MSTGINSAIVSATGKTRLRAALERAKNGGAPCVGQWMEFAGYTLARTIAGLGHFDVSCPDLEESEKCLVPIDHVPIFGVVGVDRLRTWEHHRQ